MRALGVVLGFVLTISSVHAATEEAITVKTPRGEALPLNLHLPEGTSKAPVLVIAPGAGYHKDQPIFTGIAEKATPAGLAVIRFNWAYCKLDPVSKRCTGKYSADLSSEDEDLRTVIEFAKANPKLDASQIIIAGKSLGTLVSYSVFKQDPSLKGLFLLTPLCTDTDEDGSNPRPSGEANYPGLSEITRPVLFLLGNADEACSVPMLYDFAKNTKGNTSIVVVGGDHGLLFGKDEGGYAARNAANVSAATSMIVHWANLLLER